MFSRHLLRRWFGPRPGTIRKSAPPRTSRQGPPRLEELESRLVMAARVSLTGGVLRAVCDNAATTVTLNQAGTTTTLNGRSFANAAITRIDILGGASKDTINILGTPAGKPVTVKAGGGNDAVQIGNPANPASVRGSLTVDAGSGDDVLRVENAAASSRLVLNLGTGYDNTYLHASAARSVTVNDPTANGELGWVAVGASKLNLTNSTNRITGAVHVTSAATLYVMDATEMARTITVDQDPTGTNGRVVGLTAVPITYTAGQVNNLAVSQDGHCGNTFVINNPAVREYTSIGSGLGNDAVNLLATTTDVYSVNFGGRDTFTIGSRGQAGGGTVANIRANILVGDDLTGLTDLVVDNGGDVVAHDIVFGGSSPAMADLGGVASFTGVSAGEIAIYSPLASVTLRGGVNDKFTQVGNFDFSIVFKQDALALAAIRQRHAELSGDRGILGPAVSGLQATPDGRALFMNFQHGAIYWTAERGAIALHSGNWVKYQQYGRHTGPLGLPIAEETAILNNTAVIGRYESGAVYYTRATGTMIALHSGNWMKYLELGAHDGGMGLPTSEETSILNGTAVMGSYQRGAIYWSQGTGLHAVHSGNWVKYQQLGAHNGGLGLPTSDETRIKGGAAVVATYQRGAIYYSQATGMLAVHSGNWLKYKETGAHDGPLGLPLSEEYSILGGRAVMARYEGGAIYYTPATNTIFALHSGNWVKYQQLGAQDGPLGLPLSEHISILNGTAVMARYEGGAVYWSQATGTWAVQGLIGERYHALGGAAGLLGLPISDEFTGLDGFRVSRFQYGSLVFRNDVGVQLSFDRAEMLRLFERVGQDGKVDEGEMNFLRQIVGDAKVYMPDYVRNLANKVVNGDRANETDNGYRYTQPLGNLKVGSSRTDLERLVGKWFRGTDHPTAIDETYNLPYAYERATGSLFGPAGPKLADIVQGGTGDCSLLASLGAVVERNPQAIRDMIIDNGDGTFTVRFFRSGSPEYVTVDRWFPSNRNGFVFANMGKKVNDTSTVLWAALVEKAYAQLNQSGWLALDGTNTYEGISGIRPGFAMSQITGLGSGEVSMHRPGNIELLAAVAQTGKLIVLGSNNDKEDIVSPLIEANHAYTLVRVYDNNEYFLIYNPWATDRQTINDGYILLTRQEMQANFRNWTWGD